MNGKALYEQMKEGNLPVMIVAELSANHGGSPEIAAETIRAAKRAGADAIKLQTYTPDTITIDCNNEYFQIKHGTLWDGRNLYDLYQEAYTPWEWHGKLFRVAKEEGLMCFSTPFDPTAVDFLEQFDPPFSKVASYEITDIPLIQYIASKGRPVIISTGIAKLEDIELALKTCRDAGNDRIILLQCTSGYPSPVEESNLVRIRQMADDFGVLTGLSDHSPGITVAVTSVAMGARMIEKHFILDKAQGGPDVAFSLDPGELKNLVDAVRIAEKAIGKGGYALPPSGEKGRKFSRSLFVTRDIKAGELISPENVRSIRPGDGLHPKYLNEVMGKRAKTDLKMGSPLEWGMMEP